MPKAIGPTVLIVLSAVIVTAAGAVGQPGEGAAPPPVVDLSAGWDWGAVPSLDDAPVTQPAERPPVPADSESMSATRPETAEPDFDAAPRQAYAVFKDVPPFEVIPSKRDKGMHPCSGCHQWVLSNIEPRPLKKPHDNFQLQHGLHGKGSFWCFTCHDLKGSGELRTLEGEKLEFNDAYVLCSQCHVGQARDWVYGAHGKRVSGWQEKRQVLNCTACHYQHRPELKPRAAQAGPGVRMGLDRPAHWVAQDRRPVSGDHGPRSVWKEREPVPQQVEENTGPAGAEGLTAGDKSSDERS